MNLTALVARCENRFRDTGNAIYTEDDWIAYINDAKRDVDAAASSWSPPGPWLEQQASAVLDEEGAVELPDDTFRVTAVYDSTNLRPLAPLDGRSNYRHYFPDPANQTGDPLYYRFWGNVIEVYPRPTEDVSIVIDYFAPTADLTLASDSNTPAIPSQYHNILVYGAMAYAYEDDGDMNMASLMKARFDERLAQMRHDLTSSRHEGYTEIVDIW